jgi:hypothetical protein
MSRGVLLVDRGRRAPKLIIISKAIPGRESAEVLKTGRVRFDYLDHSP